MPTSSFCPADDIQPRSKLNQGKPTPANHYLSDRVFDGIFFIGQHAMAAKGGTGAFAELQCRAHHDQWPACGRNRAGGCHCQIFSYSGDHALGRPGGLRRDPRVAAQCGDGRGEAAGWKRVESQAILRRGKSLIRAAAQTRRGAHLLLFALDHSGCSRDDDRVLCQRESAGRLQGPDGTGGL